MPAVPPAGDVGKDLVCHINIAAGYRGGERQTELLVKDLAKRGWRQRLIVRRGSPLAGRCRGVDGLDVTEVVGQPGAAWIAARGSSLVHAHEARSIYAGWLLQMSAGVPYLFTRRVDNPLKRSRLRDLAYRRADRIVTLSCAIATIIKESYPDLECKIVPDAHSDLAATLDADSDIRAQYAGRTVIGHIGALDNKHKGQRSIIRAAALASRSDPELLFVLVGDGRDGEELRRAAIGLDNVVFTGRVDDVGAYLAAFDVFLYPSLHEGLGSSLLDAMCFGLPIIASRVGGIPEIVEHEVNGLLIAPEDPEGIVGAIEIIRSSPGVREAMRRANLEKSALYGADRMANAYEEIYRSILSA